MSQTDRNQTSKSIGRPPLTVRVRGKIVDVSLEPDFWRALAEICVREATDLESVCNTLDFIKPEDMPMKAAIELFVLDYFRKAATEAGHVEAAHGPMPNEGTVCETRH